MATYQRLMELARQADADGRENDAARLVAMIKAGKYDDKAGKGESFLQGFGQGATFGFADEAAAGVRAAAGSAGIGTRLEAAMYGLGIGTHKGEDETFSERYDRYMQDWNTDDSFSERYDQALSSQRDALHRARRDEGGVTLAGELIGGLAQGGPTGAKNLAGVGLRQAALRGAGMGAGYGALSGAGYSEADLLGGDIEGFGRDVAGGAIGGAVFGGAMPYAGAGVRKLARPFLASRGTKLTEKARQRLVQDLQRDLELGDITPEQLPEILKRQGMTIGDLGPNLQARMGEVAQTPGQGGKMVRDFVEDRMQGSYDRAVPELAEGLGGASRNFAAVQDDIITQTKSAADELYKQAYAVPTRMTDEISGILDTPAGRSAVRDAQKLMMEEGRQFEPISGRMASTETMDYIVQALDDKVSTLFSKKPKLALRIKANREKLKEAIFRQNKVYREARQTWSQGKSAEEALDYGRKIFREDFDFAERTLKDMSEGELQLFRVGVMRAVENKLKGKADLTDISKVFKNRKAREALRVAFGSETKFKKFLNLMDDEAKFHQTFKAAQKGRPDPKSMKNRLAGIAGFIAGAHAGRPVIGMSLAQSAANKLPSREQAIRNATAPLLLGNDLSALQQPMMSIMGQGNPMASAMSTPIGGLLSGREQAN